MTDAIKLSGCPFCAGEAWLPPSHEQFGKPHECRVCGATGPDPLHGAHWNTRAPITAQDALAVPMCGCISANCPEQGGTVVPLSVRVPEGLAGAGGIISVDSCIIGAVADLWAAGISTYSNCCGHNGLFPRHVVVDIAAAGRAREILDAGGWGSICVSAWDGEARVDDMDFVPAREGVVDGAMPQAWIEARKAGERRAAAARDGALAVPEIAALVEVAGTAATAMEHALHDDIPAHIEQELLAAFNGLMTALAGLGEAG